MKCLLLLACLLSSALAQVDLSSYPLSAVLRDRDGEVYTLHWGFDVEAQTIRFAVNVSTTGWVGLGLSPTGGMPNSDVVIGWVNKDGQAFLQDRFATSESRPPVDPQQDWFLDGGMEMDGFTILAFRRDWVTCDELDREIKVETARMLYAWNEADPVNDDPNAVLYHGIQQRGTLSLNLLGQTQNPPPEPEGLQTIDVTVNNVSVPVDETTYWCKAFVYPEEVLEQTHYITKITPVVTEGNEAYVHHMVIYECNSLNDTHVGQSGVCIGEISNSIQQCRAGTTLAGWAVGGGEIIFPENVGYPIGGGVGPRYFVLEIHYDNPEMRTGILDSSGLLLHYTAITPQHVAGTLAVAYIVSTQMVVPPRANFNLFADCNSRCTEEFFPEEGITIFLNFLHTHLAGAGVTLRHYRANTTECSGTQEMKPIEQNLQYDFNYQQSTVLPNPIKVMPGDTLQVECNYNTMDRSGVVLGGPATQDEMCISYATYYPRIPLSSCLTLPNASVPDYLASFRKDHLPLDVLLELITASQQRDRAAIAGAWNRVNWTSEAVATFERESNDGPVTDICLTTTSTTSDILRFPHEGVIRADCEYQAPNKCTLGSGAVGVVISGGTMLFSLCLTALHMLL